MQSLGEGYVLSRPTSRSNRKYHGLGGTPTYRTWYSMIDRCVNPVNPSYRRYGGRGISVCEKWLTLDGFIDDMGLRPTGLTLDRINNDKGYCKENCRWADDLTQQRGRAGVKLTVAAAALVRERAANGRTQQEIASEFGVNPSTISRVIAKRVWK